MMTTFDEEVRDRKKLTYGAKHKKNGSKTKYVGLPSDRLTNKQLKELNGEVISYNIRQPMSWDEFIALPDDIKQEYVDWLQKIFKVTAKTFGEMTDLSTVVVRSRMEKLGITMKHDNPGTYYPGLFRRWLISYKNKAAYQVICSAIDEKINDLVVTRKDMRIVDIEKLAIAVKHYIDENNISCIIHPTDVEVIMALREAEVNHTNTKYRLTDSYKGSLTSDSRSTNKPIKKFVPKETSNKEVIEERLVSEIIQSTPRMTTEGDTAVIIPLNENPITPPPESVAEVLPTVFSKASTTGSIKFSGSPDEVIAQITSALNGLKFLPNVEVEIKF